MEVAVASLAVLAVLTIGPTLLIDGMIDEGITMGMVPRVADHLGERGFPRLWWWPLSVVQRPLFRSVLSHKVGWTRWVWRFRLIGGLAALSAALIQLSRAV